MRSLSRHKHTLSRRHSTAESWNDIVYVGISAWLCILQSDFLQSILYEQTLVLQIFGLLAFIEQKENDNNELCLFLLHYHFPMEDSSQCLFLLHYHFPMEDSSEYFVWAYRGYIVQNCIHYSCTIT